MHEQRTFSRWYWFKWRVAGRFFPVPEALTHAWYSQGCPTPDVFARPALSLRERLNWRISLWLRECKTRGGWRETP